MVSIAGYVAVALACHCWETAAIDAIEDAWVRRARRQSPDVDVEATANGQIKHQQRHAAGGSGGEMPHDKLRCQTAQDKAPDFTKAAQGLDTFENIADAQACALLCNSNPACTAFYHVKNVSHPLYKNCILSQWTGQLAQLLPNNCCDAGFPCSAVELMAPHQAENQILKQRAEERAKQTTMSADHYETVIAGQQHDIERLNKALGIRQKTMVEKDVKNAFAVNAVRTGAHEVDALVAQNKQYKDQIAKVTGEEHTLNKENEILTRREEESSKRAATQSKNYEAQIGDQRKDIQRLYKALGIRQKMMVRKDVANAEEREQERRLLKDVRRLTADADSLNEQLVRQTFYLYTVSAALALTVTLLLSLAGFAAWERREISVKVKHPRAMMDCTNAQLSAQ